MVVHKIIFVFVFVVVAVYTAIPEISINSSQVPNISYEFEAKKDLELGYSLHPYDVPMIVRIFSELFNRSFPEPYGWKVSIGCSLLYQPAVAKVYYVALNVKTGNATTVITIFN
nr:unnamed protein product [Callosobruchus chinensis]